MYLGLPITEAGRHLFQDGDDEGSVQQEEAADEEHYHS